MNETLSDRWRFTISLGGSNPHSAFRRTSWRCHGISRKTLCFGHPMDYGAIAVLYRHILEDRGCTWSPAIGFSEGPLESIGSPPVNQVSSVPSLRLSYVKNSLLLFMRHHSDAVFRHASSTYVCLFPKVCIVFVVGSVDITLAYPLAVTAWSWLDPTRIKTLHCMSTRRTGISRSVFRALHTSLWNCSQYLFRPQYVLDPIVV